MILPLFFILPRGPLKTAGRRSSIIDLNYREFDARRIESSDEAASFVPRYTTLTTWTSRSGRDNPQSISTITDFPTALPHLLLPLPRIEMHARVFRPFERKIRIVCAFGSWKSTEQTWAPTGILCDPYATSPSSGARSPNPESAEYNVVVYPRRLNRLPASYRLYRAAQRQTHRMDATSDKGSMHPAYNGCDLCANYDRLPPAFMATLRRLPPELTTFA